MSDDNLVAQWEAETDFSKRRAIFNQWLDTCDYAQIMYFASMAFNGVATMADTFAAICRNCDRHGIVWRGYTNEQGEFIEYDWVKGIDL